MPREVALLDGLSRPDWLALRRQGIGSSDVAGICGLSPWSSPLSVFLDKIGDADEVEETDQMRMGRKLEDVIASEFEERTDAATVRPTALYQHPEIDWMLASPDRFVIDPEAAVLELKTYTGRGEAWDDGPPPGVVLQVTHQLLVTEHTVGWVALLAHGVSFRHWRVELDDHVAGLLVDLETDFWRRVQDREPPPADGHPATTAALGQLYRAVEPGTRVDLTDQAGLVRDLVAARAAAAEAEKEKKRVENLVKAALGNAEVGFVLDQEAVSWKASSEFDAERFTKEHPLTAAKYSRVSVKALEAEHPALAAQYRVAGAGSRRLLPKKGWA